MSYSGFTEYLCLSGHYSTCDVWAEGPAVCRDCGQSFRFSHGVDQTNGYDEGEPYSCRAPKAEIGHDDVWHEDHLGNHYATKLVRYAPQGEYIWTKTNSHGNATPPFEDDLAQGTEARRAETVKQGSVHDGPVAESDAPNPQGSPGKQSASDGHEIKP